MYRDRHSRNEDMYDRLCETIHHTGLVMRISGLCLCAQLISAFGFAKALHRQYNTSSL